MAQLVEHLEPATDTDSTLYGLAGFIGFIFILVDCYPISTNLLSGELT